MSKTTKVTTIDMTKYMLPISILMFGLLISASIFFGVRSSFGVGTSEELSFTCSDSNPLTEDCFRQYARDLDINEKKFDSCVLENKTADDVQESIDSGDEIGILGTPSLYIGKSKKDKFKGFYVGSVMTKDDLVDIIDYTQDHDIEESFDYWYDKQITLLDDFEKQVVEFYVSDQGGNLEGDALTQEVDRVIEQRRDLIDEAFVLQDLEVGNGMVQGKGDVVLIEYSDYECPFCAQLSNETLKEIKKEYVDNNDLRFVFRDYPLDEIHPNARGASEAARCADKAGGDYFEFYDLIFNKVYNLNQQ